MKRINFEQLANKIIKKLKSEGIECYLWHAATTGSAYIRFEDNRMGSIRLGDHAGRSKLNYKWNVRSDFPKNHKKWHKVNNLWRYYVHSSNWIDIIQPLKERQKEICNWSESLYEYYIPKHKR